MTDTTVTRESVADRQWINAAGEQVEDYAEATGFCYVDKPTNKSFTWQSGQAPGSALVMLAIFGGLTKAGNIRSTLSGPNAKDPSPDPIAGIEDWFAELDDGIWAADRIGGGIRVNPEVLAKAIAHVKGEFHAGAEAPYLAKIQAKLKVKDPGDPKGKKEILYSTLALRHKGIETQYLSMLPQHAAAPAISDL